MERYERRLPPLNTSQSLLQSCCQVSDYHANDTLFINSHVKHVLPQFRLIFYAQRVFYNENDLLMDILDMLKEREREKKIFLMLDLGLIDFISLLGVEEN